MTDGSKGDMMHAAVWDGRVMMVQERLLEELLMSLRNAMTTSTARPPALQNPEKGVGVESISEDPGQSGREEGEDNMSATSASAQTVGVEAMEVDEDGARQATHSDGPVARESASTPGDAGTHNLCGVVQVVALMVNMALKVSREAFCKRGSDEDPLCSKLLFFPEYFATTSTLILDRDRYANMCLLGLYGSGHLSAAATLTHIVSWYTDVFSTHHFIVVLALSTQYCMKSFAGPKAAGGTSSAVAAAPTVADADSIQQTEQTSEKATSMSTPSKYSVLLRVLMSVHKALSQAPCLGIKPSDDHDINFLSKVSAKRLLQNYCARCTCSVSFTQTGINSCRCDLPLQSLIIRNCRADYEKE